MSKASMNTTPKQESISPYKKDNRGHSSSNDKRSGNFSKPDRPSPRDSNRPGAGRTEERNEFDNSDNQSQGDKDKETTTGEKKFTGRCRLFVGNLTPDITDTEFRKMFEPFGEISEVYVNTSRGFGFIRLDYRQNAESAKAALDGMQRKGRILRVRFATHGAALKVKNLHSYVSNELLEQSFSQFGELERCIVIVDDRGKSTGEGIVEFVRKPGANSALRRITEGVFLIGGDPKPVFVEPLEQKDEEDGMPEKFLTKTDQYKKEREKEPRFAPPGTFEYEFGMRWKQLDELEKQRIEKVKKDTDKNRLDLEEEMQNALYDYQAEQIRQDLLRQQEELRRLEELRNSERLRRQQEMDIRRQKEEREMAQQEDRHRERMMTMSRQQQELARGRGGPMDGPGMRSREEMMMAERFGDRMADRMGERMPDRMPDRMGDRMGQGGPGFNMWQEEKQRNEAAMKGMRGNEPPNRGREIRGGPGSQPMQTPQGGPQAAMERGPGGPAGPSGPGGPNQGGPGAQSTPSAGGGNAKEGPKPLMQPGAGFNMGGQGNNGPQNNQGNLEGGGNNMESGCDSDPSHKDEDGGCEDQVGSGGTTEIDATATKSPSLSPTLEKIKVDVVPKPPWMDEDDTNNEMMLSKEESIGDSKEISHTECLQEDMHVSSEFPEANDIADANTDIEMQFHAEKELLLLNGDSSESLTYSNVLSEETIVNGHSSHEPSYQTVVCDMENDESGKKIDFHTDSNVGGDDDSVCYLSEQPCAETCNSVVAPNESDISSKPCLSVQTIDDSISSQDTQLDQLDPVVNCSLQEYSLSSNPTHTHQPCTSYTVTSTTSNCESLMNYQTSSMSKNEWISSASNVSDNRSVLPSSLHEPNDDETITNQTMPCSSQNDIDEKDTCEELPQQQNASPNNEISDSSKDDYFNSNYVSSYRQNLSGNSEEMDAEGVEDSDSNMRTTDPNIYQSYETSDHYIPMVGVEENSQWQQSSDIVLCPETSTDFSNSQDSISDVVIVSDDQATTSTSNSSASCVVVEKSSNDEAFRTGDQTFKTAASREAALASIAPTSSSSSSIPSASIPGLNQPSTMMSSSTMHIAQHQGGATIMQHQMRASPGGRVAQATMLQKQALPNGGQAVVQQRTITNGGQTMVVQQHTMTNGLGGITQQTVVQQRVIPNMAQARAAALHATALRQHAMATQQAAQASAMQQQASAMQQQALRLSRPVFRAPTLAGTVLHRAGTSAILGPRLVQGATAQASMMQRLVRQRYLGGPVLHPVRGVHMFAGRPIRVKMGYPNEPTG